MRIVFYSTNSNVFDEDTFKINVMPSNASAFKDFCAVHSDDDFFCVTQKPGMFLPEFDSSEGDTKSQIHYLPQETDTDSFVDFVLSLKPDLAIAMTFWISPYDWLPVSDAIVAEKLEAAGVKTVCHSVECGLNCFDKWRTHNLLAQLGFTVPKAVFVDHDLYFCAGSNREVLRNVYKESVMAQIKKLKLPLIIKDTTGLSSYGMTVVHTYGEAAGYLNSKRNNSNRLIEEFIEGRQYGLEIYGVPGKYTVLPPFTFSVNQYGITSPKQSIKIGPCELPDSLREMMLSLAEKLELHGCAQVDLILDNDGNWNIIEINPRLSGMSYTYASCLGMSLFEMMFRAAVNTMNDGAHNFRSLSLSKGENTADVNKYVLNLKLPLVSESQMKEILKLPGVRLLNQTNDLAAKQEREKGFCECIIVDEQKSVLEKTVARLCELFPEDAIVQQSALMLKQWNL
ncbi:ATP-grasp domain-containing protein [Treponema bryantii]|uniref:ATP-grasp domain-containing protein n=1 Tax=Treponema bryantii TaxID=163 RepID=A0A1H9B5X9_9SPIR|nr:ATP-grasp domain-containing protein [Treponema bryantii]SEP84440.1 ATP-grasp domain-containing protein [Treponema bryantii]